jgi:CheY-like chemotaxis protein
MPIMTASSAAAVPGTVNKADTTRSSPSSAGRVLIVDDASFNRKVLAAMLSQFSFFSTTAASGAEAIKILESEHLDAVISDLRMHGMSGMELLLEVRRLFPLPGIFSGHRS